jgi:hypothetical protein
VGVCVLWAWVNVWACLDEPERVLERVSVLGKRF